MANAVGVCHVKAYHKELAAASLYMAMRFITYKSSNPNQGVINELIIVFMACLTRVMVRRGIGHSLPAPSQLPNKDYSPSTTYNSFVFPQ